MQRLEALRRTRTRRRDLRVSSSDNGVETPPEVVTHPPHPLLWWGTPSTRQSN